MKRIGVFTSGGDSPGMNAAIRAVVRTCLFNNIEPIGIYEGYQGLIEGNIHPLSSEDVSNIIQRGGTILRSSRSTEFLTQEGRKRAYEQISKFKLDGLIAIGGDGTFTGASVFQKEFGVKIIGIPGTIDNDLFGTDNTIGYDTALNTVVEAVDKIRDTASSHNRVFLVEVMGKDAGFIALRSGIGVGAESILIPETPTLIDELINKLERQDKKLNKSMIVLVSEGDDGGGAYSVADKIKARCPENEIRVTVLGHIQRGGNPSALDRVLASQLGNAAVNALIQNKSNVMVGIIDKKVAYTPFEKSIKHHQKIDAELINLANILSF